MEKNRLTYREFKANFLIAVAIACEGDFDAELDPHAVAATVEGRFPNSWVREVASDLRNEGAIDTGFGASGDNIRLMGPGLHEAERMAPELGFDLWEEIDERVGRLQSAEQSSSKENEGQEVSEEPKIVVIDPLSEVFQELDRELKATIDELRGRNELIQSEGSEASQRLAELEAGKKLLQAEQADATLVKRVLLPSLNWFAKKVRDEGVSALIKRLITLIVAYLEGSL